MKQLLCLLLVLVAAPALAQTYTVAAVGDIMIGTDYPKNILPDDDGVSFLDGVKDVLASADITFGNLEGTLRQRWWLYDEWCDTALYGLIASDRQGASTTDG